MAWINNSCTEQEKFVSIIKTNYSRIYLSDQEFFDNLFLDLQDLHKYYSPASFIEMYLYRSAKKEDIGWVINNKMNEVKKKKFLIYQSASSFSNDYSSSTSTD